MAFLTNFNFTIEYQCGKNNAAANALSQVNESLSACEVKAILNETVVGCQDRADLILLMAQRDEEEQVWVTAAHALKEEMHMIDWVEAQNEDPIIQKTIKWIHSGRERFLKYYLRDHASTLEGLGFISRQKSLVLVNGKLYLNCKLKGEAETTIMFVVPKAHR